MRSGGDSVNYFPENKLTKLANFVQFMRMLMFCLEDWWAGPFLAMPLWLACYRNYHTLYHRHHPLSFVVAWHHCRPTPSLCIVAHHHMSSCMSSCVVVVCHLCASCHALQSRRRTSSCFRPIARHRSCILLLYVVVIKWQSRPLFSLRESIDEFEIRD